MANDDSLSPEMTATLRRYLEIQGEEQRLREEKAALQDSLAAHLAQRRLATWYPHLDGQPLKVRFSETAVVEYDEGLLRERLGERFAVILAPDIRKLRPLLSELAPLLAPVMDRVGSPAADKVRAAIEQGLVRKEEFAGAFRKTTRRVVAVGRVRPEAPAAAGPEEG